MQKPTLRRQYTTSPPGKRRPYRLLWMLWALVTVAALFGTSFELLARTEFASHRSYLGEVRPSADPVNVALPAGGLIKQIVVERNQVVRKGQTLAILDVSEMEQQLDNIHAQLVHDRVLRDCLLQEHNLQNAKPVADTSSETEARVNLAIQTCKAHFNETSRLKQTANTMQSVLDEKQKLIDRYLRFLTRSIDLTDSPRKQEKRVRQALGFGFAVNALEDQISQLEIEKLELQNAHSNSRLQRLEELSKAILESQTRQELLKQQIENPRLYAPMSGTVVHIRSIRKSVIQQDAIDFLTLRPVSDTGYVTRMSLPRSYIDGVNIGDQVVVKLVGIQSARRQLMGRVTQIFPAQGNEFTAIISLESKDAQYLDDPASGIALRGEKTAALVQIRKPEFSALEVVVEIFSALFRPNSFFGEAIAWAAMEEDLASETLIP